MKKHISALYVSWWTRPWTIISYRRIILLSWIINFRGLQTSVYFFVLWYTKYMWKTISIKILTKLKSVPIDEIYSAFSTMTDELDFQLTKCNDEFAESVDRRRNWKEHSHIPQCSGHNIMRIFTKLVEDLSKMSGKTYYKSVNLQHNVDKTLVNTLSELLLYSLFIMSQFNVNLGYD